MSSAYLLPIIVGLCIVLQSTFNSYNITNTDFNTTIFWAGLTFFIFSTAVYLLAIAFPQYTPDMFKVKSSLTQFNTYNMVAGVCGVLIVSLMPVAFRSIGASVAIILVILSQIIFGMITDAMFAGNPISVSKLLGAFVTLMGAIIYIFGNRFSLN